MPLQNLRCPNTSIFTATGSPGVHSLLPSVPCRARRCRGRISEWTGMSERATAHLYDRVRSVITPSNGR